MQRSIENPRFGMLVFGASMLCNTVVSAKSVETLPAIQKPMPMTRLMLSRSPRPQYWLMSTLDPLCNPKTMNWMIEEWALFRHRWTADICSLAEQTRPVEG